MATQINLDAFATNLTAQYEELYRHPDYAMAKAKYSPSELARKMTLGLDNGTANKDGEGIRRTCKALGIAYTYEDIRAFLTAA